MKSLIVTNTHNTIGKVIDLQFTDHAKTYSDDEGNLYYLSDFVEIDSIDHEQNRADKMAEHYTLVSQTIAEFRKKEASL